MKAFFFALLVAAATAIPLPDDSGPVDVVVHGIPKGEPLEIGHLLDVNVHEKVNGEVVSSANVLYPFSAQGLSEAAAIAEEVVADPELLAPVESEDVSPIALPETVKPEVVPAPVELPSPAQPEVAPPSVELPSPAEPEVVPSPIELPAPALPEVAPSPIELPAPALPEVAPTPIELPKPALPEVAPEIVPEAVEVPAPQPEVVPEVVHPVEVVEVAESLPAPAPQELNFNDGIVNIQTNVQDSGLLNTLSDWFNLVVNYVSGNQVTHTTEIL